MKFFDFLESSYVTTNVHNQISYSPMLAGRIMAIQRLISWQRSILSFVNLFVVCFNYGLVILKIKDVPKTAKEQVESMQSNAKTTAALSQAVK